MSFSHVRLDFNEVEASTTNNGYRTYNIDGSPYVSVTTMLGASKSQESKEALENWYQRLGEEKAKKESTRCADRGTAVHLALENYVGNKLSFKEAIKDLNPWHQIGIKAVKKYIDKIDQVRAQEIPLWSHVFRLAGRVDCVASYNGIPSIIDYKTSTKKKRREWIGDYFLQCAIYSYMFEEMFGLRHTQLVVIIEVEGSEAQVFISDRNDHKHELKTRIETFRSLKNDQ